MKLVEVMRTVTTTVHRKWLGSDLLMGYRSVRASKMAELTGSNCWLAKCWDQDYCSVDLTPREFEMVRMFEKEPSKPTGALKVERTRMATSMP